MTTETKFTVGEYRMRDGTKARVYATDGGGTYPIHGAWWLSTEQRWKPCQWKIDGVASVGRGDHADLMPPLREWWIVAGEAWDNEREALDYCRLLQNSVKPVHVREVRDDQA